MISMLELRRIVMIQILREGGKDMVKVKKQIGLVILSVGLIVLFALLFL